MTVAGWVTVLGMVLALDGVRVATLTPSTTARQRTVGIAIAATVAVVVAAAVDPIIDAGDISPETLRIGVGLVVAAVGVVRLMVGAGQPYEEVTTSATAVVPVAFPVALTPELVAWSASRGADALVPTLVGVAVSVGVAALAVRLDVSGARRRLGDAWVRLTAAGLTTLGVVLVIDGIRSV